MDILSSWFKELAPTKDEKKRESIVITMNKIIRKHQKIIIFSKYVEDLYTYVALVQFTLNTVLICSLAFLIVTVSTHEYKFFILSD